MDMPRRDVQLRTTRLSEINKTLRPMRNAGGRPEQHQSDDDVSTVQGKKQPTLLRRSARPTGDVDA